jgi:hypothetical protein
MVKRSYSNQINKHLESITVRTWFDIGYFLDKLRTAKPMRPNASVQSNRAQKAVLRNVAFLTYSLGRDDVSDEMIKTAAAWRKVAGANCHIHWLAGQVNKSAHSLIRSTDPLVELPLLRGFEAWGEPYKLLFHTKLSLNHPAYNELPLKIWAETKKICLDLLNYIEENDIELILAANVASNPGNLSLTLALVIISELYNLNVISSNHDFYWEGVSSPQSRRKTAPRDHFYTNADLGVMFSIVEMLYPWSSAKWVHVNRHLKQSKTLTDTLGFNPFNVTELTKTVPRAAANVIPQKQPSTEKQLENGLAEIQAKIKLIRRGDGRQRALAIKALNYIFEAPREQKSRLIFDKNRSYIPGLLRLRFLSQVKSYIDPGYFRVEERQTKGRVYAYAAQLIPPQAAQSQQDLFYRSLSFLLRASKGRHAIEFDTTFDYRYRDSTKYLWRELTEPQLLGAVTHLADTIFKRNDEILPPFSLINLMNFALSDSRLVTLLENQLSACLALDISLESLATYKSTALKQLREQVRNDLDRPLIVHDKKFFQGRIINKPQSLVVLPGSKNTVFWQLFVLDRILAHWNAKDKPYQIVFACRSRRYGNDLSISELVNIVQSNIFPYLKIALDAGQLTTVAIGTRSASIDLLQVSADMKKALLHVKKAGGHVLAKGEQNYFSLDLLDIDSFRYGTAHSLPAKAAFDVDDEQGFVQFVPAGLRSFFAFPLTIETPAQFSRALNSVKLSSGLLRQLKIYLDKHGTSLQDAIRAIGRTEKEKDVFVKRLSGKYTDGYAWTGVAVTLKPNKAKHSFHIVSSKKNKTLPQFVQAFERRVKDRVIMAWNGGYILNLELVGKMRISYDLIGVPLGLIIARGKVLSLPLFNRPVFAVKENGQAFIGEITLDFPGRIMHENQCVIEWKADNINPAKLPDEETAVYSPYGGLLKIPVKDRIIVVIGGQKVISVTYPEDHKADQAPLFPAGITFSLPASQRKQVAALKELMEIRLDVDLSEPWSKVAEAMEGGPTVIKNGEYNLDLKNGGWLLEHSLRTQVTRRDRENERWPLIGCGITKSGQVISVVIESRIRESVGATHAELAEIMLREGAVVAMEFDSGGSASLYTEKGMVNIVPYTSTFNEKPLTGRSEARPVANAVLVRARSVKK